MKWFEKLKKTVAKKATSAVMEEVKDVSLDLLPTILTIIGVVGGAALCYKHFNSGDSDDNNDILSSKGPINITTNNYNYGNYYYGTDLAFKVLSAEDDDHEED